MTPRKESALGRGLDALIRPEVIDKENSDASEKNKSKSKISATKSKKSKAITPKKEPETANPSKIQSSVDETLVASVLLEIHKNPRISLWSAKSAAVLRLLKKTKPEFSISKEASALIEGAVKDKYPELWKIFEDKDI